MENKYYQPDITEFHVGFEFESNYVGFSSDLKWKKILLNNSHDWFWTAYKQDAVETEFRVKYLDKEDIESLGFEYDGKSCLDETWEKEESIVDTWSYYVDTTEDKEKYYSLYSQGKLCYITYTAYQNSVGSTVDQIFKGTIKNKSELKKVLKILNIN